MAKKKQGFTLLEIIIALTITVIILGIVSSMFIVGNKVFSDSDVKSTLQIDGQSIQEKISNIGMQATTAQAVTVKDSATNEINDVTINSYDKDGNLKQFKIAKEDSKYNLTINGELISSNVKNVMLDHDTIAAANANTLKNINSIEFNIILRKEKGYSDVEQTINFRVAFRNK